MPALDGCEPQIVRALGKAGWLIVDKPFPIRLGHDKRFVYADVKFEHEHSHEQLIVVEVKCFPVGRSRLDELYHALGQYQVYCTALKLRNLNFPLYLAVPHEVYENLLLQDVEHQTLQEIQIKLIIVNLETEEIVKWID